MAAQQAHIAETIRAMKLALRRHPPSSPHPASYQPNYSSDDENDLSDTSNHAATNRGQKLKRHARYTRAGRLDDTGGVAGYKRKVQHAGYTRNVIAKKPRVVDNDGDLIPSPPSSVYGGDEEAELDARGLGMVEDDAFGSVRLERLLRPLTRASELPDHPSLSRGFKSKALTHMVDEISEMVRRERQSLWKAKRLMARLRGEGDWVPCGVFEAEGGLDEVLLLIGQDGGVNGGVGVESVAASITASVAAVPDIEMGETEGVEANDMAVQSAVEKQEDGGVEVEAEEKVAGGTADSVAANGVNGTAPSTKIMNGHGDEADALQQTTSHESQNQALPSTELPPPDKDAPDAPDAADEEDQSEPTSQTNPNAPSHGMTTRARARSPIPSPSPSPSMSDTSTIPPINPWFDIPATALPDRDLGLPVDEAEDTRKLLLLYIQKQEQIIRSLEDLYSGLQRADRLRRHVYQSAKAEGHTKVQADGVRVTEMSDGEDWYDPSDWGLGWQDLKLQKDGTYGLEKGKDEAEDLFVGDDAAGEGRRVGGRRRRVQRM